jgi:PKD repeat protein
VTIVDSNHNRDTKTITITTTPQEIPSNLEAPTAMVRVSETCGTAPFSTSLDGLGSTGGSGEITDYIWDFNDDSPRKHGAIAVHSYTTPGTYHPVLTVVNSQGIYNSSAVTVVVTTPDSNNKSPKARFANTVVQLDDTLIIEFDASGSFDPDGSIVNCTWKFGNSSFQTGSNVTHTFSVNKVTSIALTVTDNTGAQNTMTMSTITFLKEIHGNVIHLINSLLLNKKTP